MTRIPLAALSAVLLLGACKKEAPPPLYEAVPVATRDIVVAASAAGAVEPILVVDVKSKASGEIMDLRAETGDMVRQGELLVAVDPREPRNQLAQAEADLEVARSQLSTAESQRRRAEQMFQQQLVSEQEYEQSVLQFANARAQQVRAERAVQTARDQLDDTNVRAPITGTIIQKSVERGQVIASATREVSGGTVLLRMADLSNVQVRTLVDETDIGKIQPGMIANITVDAFPNRPFQGTVLKIEPQSQVQQNVTMFPVLIRIGNEQGLLRPGMNTEVEIQVAQRSRVLAIPNAALRTQRDVASASRVLGLNPDDVQATLARADSAAGRSGPGGPGGPGAQQAGAPQQSGSLGGQSAPQAARESQPSAPQAQRRTDAPAASQAPGGAQPGQGGSGGGQMAQGGQRPPLPEGVSETQWNEIRRKRQAGEALTPAESTISARVRESFMRAGGQMGGGQMGGGQPGGQMGGQMSGGPPAGMSGGRSGGFSMSGGMQGGMPGGQPGGQRRRFGAGNNFQFGGSYIVFVLRDGKPEPVRIRTGVTDMDYSEVVGGLTAQDTVLLLPSASLIASQQEMRDRFQRMAGGGVPGMRQQAPAQGGGGGGAARPQGR